MELKVNQIHIGICRNETMDANLFERYSSLLSLDIQDRIQAKVYQSDKQALLLGRLLLREYCKAFVNHFQWSMIRYSDYGKPYLLGGEFEFNISHSGRYVICSVQKIGLVGIDIEEIKKMNISDFKTIFCEEELLHLNSSKTPQRSFYKIWTRKEAFTKALGIGLSYTMNKMNSLNNLFDENGKSITVSEVNIDPDYVLSYASDIQSPQVILRNFSF